MNPPALNLSSKESIKHWQQLLLELGLYSGLIDGLWGELSNSALAAYKARLSSMDNFQCPKDVPIVKRKMVWGQAVSQTFRDRVFWIVDALDMPEHGEDWLMAVMAFESARSFSPKMSNKAGSGATGLIQFMPSTAIMLGTTTAKLAAMTAEDQLNYVYKYLSPYRGKLKSLSDVYMAVLWPAAVGKPENHILWTSQAKPTTYRQNAGLDINKDGKITKAEAASFPAAMLQEGIKLR